MSSMAYKTTMFAVFFNYGMIIANYLGTLLFRDGSPQMVISNSDSTILNLANMITPLLLTAGVLGLFAFSLLIPTIPFILMFFALNSIISAVYINQLIPSCTSAIGTISSTCVPGTEISIFSVPITMGLLIVYYMGIAEYSARQKI